MPGAVVRSKAFVGPDPGSPIAMSSAAAGCPPMRKHFVTQAVPANNSIQEYAYRGGI